MPKEMSMTYIPKFANGVKLQRRRVRLDLIRKDGMVITLNSTGTIIGEYIDGKNTLIDILNRMEERYIIGRGILKKDLLSLIERLNELKYIEFDSSFEKKFGIK